MTDRRDDDFRVRPSAPKNRGKGQGQSFVSKVLKQAGKASSGKSTVLRIMAGVDTDFEGEARPQPGIKVGYLEQEPQLDPQHTVREAVEELLEARELPRRPPGRERPGQGLEL